MRVLPRHRRSFALLVSTWGLLSLAVAPAAFAAAPPANDTYAGRITVSDGYSATLDTTGATTDADDAAMNANCGAPVTDASVWYELAGTDETYLVDLAGSDYSAGVIAATGDPVSGFNVVSCGPGSIAFFASTGTTYAILVFDDTAGGGNGGSLSIAVNAIAPPSIDSFTVDSVGHFAKDGSATVSGTISCSADALLFSEIDLTLVQRVGRVRLSGFGASFPACDGTTENWSATIQADNGLFRGGKATLTADAIVCNQAFDCASQEVQKTFSLKK
jgi:hypothetical protein